MSSDIATKAELTFRSSAATGIALVTLFAGAPFGVINWIEGHLPVAIAALGMTLMLCIHAVALRRQAGLNRTRRSTGVLIVPCGIVFLVLAAQQHGAIGLLWAYPAILGFYALVEERLAWLGNIAVFVILLPLSWQSVDSEIMMRITATLFAVSALSAVQIRALHRHHRWLVKRIETDPLTGLLNRHSLEPTLDHARLRYAADNTSMALLSMDIDHFKRINDVHGHAAGDQMLKRLGKSLRANIRASDSAFRIGGEEFLVLLNGTSLGDARQLAESLRLKVQTEMSHGGPATTISAGVAALEPTQSLADWTHSADHALYAAKSAGRNCTCTAPTDAKSRARARFGVSSVIIDT